jgi:hypothetical protein
MKRWTQHDARSSHIVEADQFNSQHTSFRGQMTGLDRSQYPAGCVSSSMLTANAMHKVWTFVPWASSPTYANTQGEQTAYRAEETDTLPEQFQALTYQEYGTGWVTAFETTLTPFKGGSLLTEWAGCCSLQIFFTWTQDARQNSTPPGRQNDKYIGMRILYNGTVVAERIGAAKPMDSFRIIGEAKVPSGDVNVQLQFNVTGAGPDDALEENNTNKHLSQAHLFANRVVCVGRWR